MLRGIHKASSTWLGKAVMAAVMGVDAIAGDAAQAAAVKHTGANAEIRNQGGEPIHDALETNNPVR